MISTVSAHRLTAGAAPVRLTTRAPLLHNIINMTQTLAPTRAESVGYTRVIGTPLPF